MTFDGIPQATVQKCSVLDAVGKGFWFLCCNLGRFFALSWLGIVIASAAYSANDIYSQVLNADGGSQTNWMAYLASAIAVTVYAVFAVRWHRFFLLDEVESVFTEIFSRRNWVFLGYSSVLVILLLLIILVVGIPLRVLVENIDREYFNILIRLLTWFLGAVFLRFFLVLPATAIERPISLGEAWSKMHGNSWRFIGAFFLGPVLTVSGIRLFVLRHFERPVPIDSIEAIVATNAVETLVEFFGTAVGITVLSIFYRQIVDKEEVSWPVAGGGLPRPPWE